MPLRPLRLQHIRRVCLEPQRKLAEHACQNGAHLDLGKALAGAHAVAGGKGEGRRLFGGVEPAGGVEVARGGLSMLVSSLGVVEGDQ